MQKLVDGIDVPLSNAQIASYEKNGYLHLKEIITEDELSALRTAVDAQVGQLNTTRTGYDFESLAKQVWSGKNELDALNADRFEIEYYKAMIDDDNHARPIQDNTNDAGDSEGMFFYEAGGWRQYAGIRETALDSALPLVCAKLMNCDYLNFWEDTTFVKAPNTNQRTAFHQDYAYFQIKGRKCCVVWIPLDTSTKKSGTMQYVRGSHLWNETFAPNVFIAQTPFFDAEDPKLPDIEGNLECFDIVTIEAEPGDVIIHDVMTVHGSSGNLTHHDQRRAISFRYCGDDIRYYDRPGAIEQPHIAENLPDGAPLYSMDYPLVWPRPHPSAKLAPFFEGMPFDG